MLLKNGKFLSLFLFKMGFEMMLGLNSWYKISLFQVIKSIIFKKSPFWIQFLQRG